MEKRIKLFVFLIVFCVFSTLYYNISIQKEIRQTTQSKHSQRSHKNFASDKISPNIDNNNDKWKKQMAEKYQMTNERIRRVCTKYRNEQPSISQNQWYLHHRIDLRHQLGYCPQYKVGTSTWSKHFLKLMPEKIRPKKDNYWNEAMLNYFKVPIDYNHYKTHWAARNWFLNFVRAKHLFLFSFVRHPFERLVSAYKEKVVETSVLDEKAQKDRLKEFAFFKANPKYREWYEKDHSFPSFIDLVLNEYAQSKHLKFNTINGHWAPMSMKCYYCDVTYDVIGRMETFSDDLKYIIKINKLENILLDDKKTRTTGGSPKHDALKYFSKLRKEKVFSLYEMYKMDFELFGYNAIEYLHVK